jgi:hypothetical protein
LVTLADPRALVDVHDPLLLADINKHYQVVAALEASELGTALNPATLDEGVIRLGGPRANPSPKRSAGPSTRVTEMSSVGSPTDLASTIRNGAGPSGMTPT